MIAAVKNTRKQPKQRDRPVQRGVSGNPAGRPRGAKNKRTRVLIEAAKAAGELPLDYMLAVMHDENADVRRRDDMAKAAAPYLHAKLSSVEVSTPPQGEKRTTSIQVTFVVPPKRPPLDLPDEYGRRS